MELLQELMRDTPRRGLNEQAAAKKIKKSLEMHQIPYIMQSFYTKIPEIKSAFLEIDGKQIPCLGASTCSGKIDGSSPILNGMGAREEDLTSMITFNPLSDIPSMMTYQDIPALTISRNSIMDVVMGKKVAGSVEVAINEYSSENILVGNTVNPDNIIFAHYDSIIGSGAVDNAGSVSILYELLTENLDLLQKHLFVFAGSEEESINSPEGFWGFKMFGDRYQSLIEHCTQLIVLDGLGVSSPIITSDNTDWVFALNSTTSEIEAKTYWLQNDQNEVMKYYHSIQDTYDKLLPQYLTEAKELLYKILC